MDSLGSLPPCVATEVLTVAGGRCNAKAGLASGVLNSGFKEATVTWALQPGTCQVLPEGALVVCQDDCQWKWHGE